MRNSIKSVVATLLTAGTRPNMQNVAEACIEAGINAGLLRRSYLAGVPRLLVGAL